MSDHPDILELELARTGEAATETTAHLERCERCRAVTRSLPTPVAFAVPADVDATIVELGWDRARAIRRRRRLRTVLVAAPVAAAAALLVILNPPAPTPARADVNGDGRVDILDAFVLARAVERSESVDPRHDLDGDARVDRADVEHIARAAVSLGGARR